MTASDLNALKNYPNVCRFCLESKELTEFDTSLAEAVRNCFKLNVEINLSDDLPHTTCPICANRINEMQSFKERCERSHNMLIEYSKNLAAQKVEAEKQEVKQESEEENDFSERLCEPLTLGKPTMSCKYCGKVYLRAKSLRRHVASHSKEEIERLKGNQSVSGEVKVIAEEMKVSSSCRYCSETFGSRNELQLHVELAHPTKRPHLCPVCSKPFSSVSNRNTHVKTHHTDDFYECAVCSKKFKSKLYLHKHLKFLHVISDHECPICLARFTNVARFDYHMRSHDPNKRFKCSQCPKSFLQAHHLANHERVHSEAKTFLCPICGFSLKHEANYRAHLQAHSGGKTYHCERCSKSFTSRPYYLMHMRRHEGVDEEKYQCEFCGKKLAAKSTLTFHLRTHTGERNFKCTRCPKAFIQAYQLKVHTRTAHRSKSETTTGDPTTAEEEIKIYPYICMTCNKGFKLPSSLASHMPIHAEDRKHHCPHCNASFKRSEHLRVHINGIHLKQKPYVCEICNKGFTQSGDRNVHMKRHSEAKPHQCSLCDKSFRLAKAMRAHLRVHTGECPFRCSYADCSDSFKTYAALAAHIAKHEQKGDPVQIVQESTVAEPKVVEETKTLTFITLPVTETTIQMPTTIMVQLPAETITLQTRSH